jgi:CheY-like chemotaxis protein
MTPRTILVADDEALLRESLCDLITDLGLVARPAVNGQGAIEFLVHGHCDLVLSDIDMPDMSGFTLLGWIREHRPVPAVLMSARADGLLDIEAHRAGALALWPKPVTAITVTSFFHKLFDSEGTSHG